MNKPRRFAQTPPRTWFSGVPGVSDIYDNMNVIKRLLSDLGDANRGQTPFNPKKLTETSKDEFAQGPLVAALGAALGAVMLLLLWLSIFLATTGLLVGCCSIINLASLVTTELLKGIIFFNRMG